MDNLRSSSYYESLKRYWRRRKYQRVYGATHGKSRLKVLRLGGGASVSPRTLWRIRRIPKLRWKIISPIKPLSLFHDAYVGMMLSLANKMANSNSDGGFIRGKNAAESRRVSLVSSGEEVDCRLVLEIYKKLAASRQLSTEL